MKGSLIVVTGISGSGKTTLSLELCNLLVGYKRKNVGDLLGEMLQKEGIDITSRRDIGPKFLERFGISGYITVLLDAAAPCIVLDGVRLLAGVRALRARWPGMIHIHRNLTGSGTIRPDTFGAEDNLIAEEADFQIGYQSDLAQVNGEVIKIIQSKNL